jgi:hypothetical protein
VTNRSVLGADADKGLVLVGSLDVSRRLDTRQEHEKARPPAGASGSGRVVFGGCCDGQVVDSRL